MQSNYFSLSRGFTLVEIMIVIGLVAVLMMATLAKLNPQGQINKAWDSQRKNDLSLLRKAFEDYYNDKNNYPPTDKVCYQDSKTTLCPICGSVEGSPTLTPYLNRLPCDPQHNLKDYYYQVDDSTTPSWYRIYSKLSNDTDPSISEVNCIFNSCGPAPQYGYNYGIASPNTDLERNPNQPTATPVPTAGPTSTPIPTHTPTPTTEPKPTVTPMPTSIQITPTGLPSCNHNQVYNRDDNVPWNCNDCGNYTQCLQTGRQLYNDSSCLNPCQ